MKKDANNEELLLSDSIGMNAKNLRILADNYHIDKSNKKEQDRIQKLKDRLFSVKQAKALIPKLEKEIKKAASLGKYEYPILAAADGYSYCLELEINAPGLEYLSKYFQNRGFKVYPKDIPHDNTIYNVSYRRYMCVSWLVY